MKLHKAFSQALNILVHSKVRSWQTMIGFVIGVAAIVAIVSIGQGAQASVESRLGGLGADLITISPGGGHAGGFRVAGRGGGDFGGSSATTQQNLTNTDIQTLKSIPGISFIDGQISGREDVTYLGQTASLEIDGVADTLAWQNMVNTPLESGRYLEAGDSNAIVLGYGVAMSTFKQPLPVNTAITIGGNIYKIVGILQSSGSGFGGSDRTIYMPIAAARTLLDKPSNYYDSIQVKVADANQVSAIVNETTQKLIISRHLLGKNQDFSVTSAQQIQSQVQSITQTLTLLLAAIAAVSLIVGAVGIANTMFTSVLEKTKEIGIMKAIGARNRDILLIYILNSGLVGLAGGILGASLGSAISLSLPRLLAGIAPGAGGGTAIVSTSLLLTAMGVSVLIGMVSGEIPAYRASRLKPVDALRSE